LEESDIFFENGDEDTLFDDWAKIIGGLGDTIDDCNGDDDGEFHSNHPIRPEECLLM
jgi:hypothetical protein